MKFQSKLAGARSLLSLSAQETRTAEGRSKERYRRIALSVLSSLGSKAITVATTLVAVPIALHHLGDERYGLWVAVSSLTAVLVLADLGLSLGLVNSLADSKGRGDLAAARRSTSTAFYVLSFLALVLAGMFAAIHHRIPWHSLFNVSSQRAVAEVGPTIAVFVGCFLVGLPFQVSQSIRAGLQEGFLGSIWLAAGSIFAFLGFLLAVALDASLPWLVLALAGGPVVVSILHATSLFVRRRWLAPRLRLVNRDTASMLFRLGFLFLVLHVAVAVGYQSDNFVIAHMLGTERVPDLAVPWKLFWSVFVIVYFVHFPLWPAYSEAIARGDGGWVKKTFRRSILVGLALTVPAAIVLFAFGEGIIRLWVGSSIDPSPLLLGGMGLWLVTSSVGSAFNMLLSGAHIVKFQVLCALAMALTNLPLSIVLTRTIGIAGPIYGTLVATLVCIYVPTALMLPRLLSRIVDSSLAGEDSAPSVEAEPRPL